MVSRQSPNSRLTIHDWLPSRRQRRAERPYIVAHHVDVSPRRAVLAGEGVGIEPAADPGAALVGDALEEPGIGDVLEEYRRDLLPADLPDDLGDVLRRGLGLGRNPLRRDEGHPVSLLEIAESVMRSDDP